MAGYSRRLPTGVGVSASTSRLRKILVACALPAVVAATALGGTDAAAGVPHSHNTSSASPGTAVNPVDYPSTILADNPTSYWRLNDTSGFTAVDQKGVYDGSIQGGVMLNQPGPIAGGASMTFDGGSGIVNLDGDTSLQFPGSFTVEGWFQTSAPPTGPYNCSVLFAQHQQGYLFQICSGDSLSFSLYDTSGNLYGVSTPASVLDGNWHYVVGVRNSSSIYLYLDGALVASAPMTGTVNYPTSNAGMADDPNCGCSYFNGSLTEVAVYGYALTAQQVANHHAAASPSGMVPVVTGLKAIGPDGHTLKCPTSYGTASCAGGPFSGGTQVTISGRNFDPISTVTFGGAPALSYTFKNSQTIIAHSPPVSNFYFPPVDGSFHSATDVYVQVASGCCGSPSSPGPSSRFTYFVPPIGLLIFNGGTDVCAATVVTSPQHAAVNTILTAGHCVANGGTTSGPGSFNSNFEFAPGYYGPISCPGAFSPSSPYSLKCGTAPYGVWDHWYLVATDKAWRVNNQCPTTCDHTYDYGFLDMIPQHGVSISSRVGGGLVITFNSGGFLGVNADQPWTLFGDNLGGNVYGTESGTALVQCTGQSSALDNQLYVAAASCPQLFAGDSGGPWINPLNGDSRGIGAVNSTAGITGTYLGDAAKLTFTLYGS